MNWCIHGFENQNQAVNFHANSALRLSAKNQKEYLLGTKSPKWHSKFISGHSKH